MQHYWELPVWYYNSAGVLAVKMTAILLIVARGKGSLPACTFMYLNSEKTEALGTFIIISEENWYFHSY